MRIGTLSLCCAFLPLSNYAQSTSLRVNVYDLFSENGAYHMRSVPFDNEEQSTYGKTYIYGSDTTTPIRVVERYFNLTGNPDFIAVSNDGRTVACVSQWYYEDGIDEQRAVVIYRDGSLLASFTAQEITGCDGALERCSFLYRNDSVLDLDGRTWVNGRTIMTYVEGTTLAERFAHDHGAFTAGDTLYLIDMKRQLHCFSFVTGEHSVPREFESSFGHLEQLYRERSFTVTSLDAPDVFALPPLANGADVKAGLAKHLKMVALDDLTTDDRYKKYTIKVDALVDRSGRMEVLNLKNRDELPEDRLLTYLTSQQYDMRAVPEVLEKWGFEQYMSFRSKPKSLAKRERTLEREEAQRAYLKRLEMDSIAGFYIPRDLGECFPQLDTLLTPILRKEMTALDDRSDMIRYHHGLGTWLRNNWGLWGGSRLQQYFGSRGVRHPDSMSGVILDHYWDWLHDQRDTWKTWEEEHPIQPQQ